MKIIFMGTPNFAVPSLQKLIDDKSFEILAVYTREPQVAGRGHKIQKSSIQQLAERYNLKVITSKTLRDPYVQKEFISFGADAAVIVAYGLILPQEILEGTKFGCFNIHPSLLPKWRGAAPIQRTIMAQDEETAICIIKMDVGLDSGNIVACQKFELFGSETYTDLEKKFAEIGAEMTIEVLQKVQVGSLIEMPQNHELATYAKKLDKSECEINWQNSAKEIDAQIRGLSGSLGAFFNYEGEKIKIFASEILDETVAKDKVGEINGSFEIQCGKGILKPKILQRAGKNKVTIEEFLLGLRR